MLYVAINGRFQTAAEKNLKLQKGMRPSFVDTTFRKRRCHVVICEANIQHLRKLRHGVWKIPRVIEYYIEKTRTQADHDIKATWEPFTHCINPKRQNTYQKKIKNNIKHHV